MRLLPVPVALMTVLGLLCIGASAAQSAEVAAVQWPEADLLFRRDSRWRGADAANSIDLGGGRVLWTFGDTFVDVGNDPDKHSRQSSVMINNTVAIQTGYDPTQARFEAYWETTAVGAPASFFRPVGDVYYWPGGGVLLDGKLLISMMRVRSKEGGGGFKIVGWGAVLIDNPQDHPAHWKKTYFDFDHTTHDVMIGCGSSVRQGKWLYSFGANAFHLRSAYLARFAVEDVLKGDFSQPQWWNPRGGCWQSRTIGQQKFPPPLFAPGAPEFTVHFDAKGKQYLLLQMEGYPLGQVTMRRACQLTGPWLCRTELLVPEEAQNPQKGLMLYSAKAHPEQEAKGLAVTYCSNNKNLGALMGDESLYYPRFLRVKFCSDSGEDAD